MNQRVPLPLGAQLGKSYEHGLDVNLGTYDVPIWQPFRRISAWAPTFPPVTQDVTTYDNVGDTDNNVSGRGFATSFTAQGNRLSTTGKLLPELDATIKASRGKDEGAILDIRFYHKPESGTPDPDDAGRALVTVEATRQNTGNSEIEVYAITLTGKGAYEPIANPFAGWGATAPVISSIGPDEAGDGEIVTITGTGLSGATAVSVGGVPVDEIAPMSATTVVFVMPDGDAGDVAVTVTTPGGVSAPFTFTRGA